MEDGGEIRKESKMEGEWESGRKGERENGRMGGELREDGG